MAVSDAVKRRNEQICGTLLVNLTGEKQFKLAAPQSAGLRPETLIEKLILELNFSRSPGFYRLLLDSALHRKVDLAHFIQSQKVHPWTAFHISRQTLVRFGLEYVEEFESLSPEGQRQNAQDLDVSVAQYKSLVFVFRSIMQDPVAAHVLQAALVDHMGQHIKLAIHLYPHPAYHRSVFWRMTDKFQGLRIRFQGRALPRAMAANLPTYVQSAPQALPPQQLLASRLAELRDLILLLSQTHAEAEAEAGFSVLVDDELESLWFDIYGRATNLFFDLNQEAKRPDRFLDLKRAVLDLAHQLDKNPSVPRQAQLEYLRPILKEALDSLAQELKQIQFVQSGVRKLLAAILAQTNGSKLTASADISRDRQFLFVGNQRLEAELSKLILPLKTRAQLIKSFYRLLFILPPEQIDVLPAEFLPAVREMASLWDQ